MKRIMAVMMLGWPLVAAAAAPKAEIKGEPRRTVVRGTSFVLDARDSVFDGDDGLVWEVESGVTSEVVQPHNGKKGSLLVVDGALPAKTYKFTVRAKGAVDKLKQTVDTADVFVTVVEREGNGAPSPAAFSVGEPVARIQGPPMVAPGTDLVLDARTSHFDPREELRWTVPQGLNYELIGPAGSPKSVLLVKQIPAGEYRIRLDVQGTPQPNGNPSASAASHVVTVADTSPSTVGVAVANGATTNPSGKLHATVVVKSGLEHFGEKVKLAGLGIHRAEDLFNFKYYAHDAASPAALKPHLQQVINGGKDASGKVWPKIPGNALVIQDEAGNVIRAEPAPVDLEGVVAKIVMIRLLQ